MEPIRVEPVRVEPVEPVHVDEPVEPLRVDERREPEEYRPISGPSLLGLDTTEEEDTTSYLLDEEDEPRQSHAGWIAFAFVAIAILAVVGLLEWRAIKTGKIEFPTLSSLRGEAPKPQNASAPSAPQIAGLAPQAESTPAQSSDGDQRLVGDEEAGKAESNWGVAPTPSPLSPGEDEAATKTAATEAAKQAGEKRAANAEDKGSTGADSSAEPAPKNSDSDKEAEAASKPGKSDDGRAEKQVAARADPAKENVEAEKTEVDPHQNRLLLAGEKYLYGRGVEQDCEQAVIYLRAAAEEQNAPAMAHLGAMYSSGQCVRQDRQTAYSWFARAQLADPKNKWITRNLNMLWRDMSPEQRAAIYR